jgi:hypothetical protein
MQFSETGWGSRAGAVMDLSQEGKLADARWQRAEPVVRQQQRLQSRELQTTTAAHAALAACGVQHSVSAAAHRFSTCVPRAAAGVRD